MATSFRFVSTPMSAGHDTHETSFVSAPFCTTLTELSAQLDTRMRPSPRTSTPSYCPGPVATFDGILSPGFHACAAFDEHLDRRAGAVSTNHRDESVVVVLRRIPVDVRYVEDVELGIVAYGFGRLVAGGLARRSGGGAARRGGSC